MRLTLLQIAARTAVNDGIVLPGTMRLREALQHQQHPVEVVTLSGSLVRAHGKLTVSAADAIWPLATHTAVARERGPIALALADELGVPTLGATTRNMHRALDATTQRALLQHAGIAVAEGDGTPGKTRAVVAWIAGASVTDEALGAIVCSANGVFEPLQYSEAAAARVARTVEAAMAALGLTEWALVELDVDAEGCAAIVSVDPLPSWEDDSAFLVSFLARGLSFDTIVSRIVGAAKTRLAPANKLPARPDRKPIRVGVIFNIKRIKPSYGGANDEEAEFDSPATIEAIAEAIRSYGHEVVLMEATPELASSMHPGIVDVVFNVAEGLRGRSRESQVPALLELCDISYTGSDPATCLLTMDKGLAKRIVRQAGVPTPNWFVMHSAQDELPQDFRYPVVVKPIAEGSSKGVMTKSVVENESALREAAQSIVKRYPDGVIVEEFLPGREFTVALLGETEPRVLPPMEIIFRSDLHLPIYTFDHKLDFNDEVRYDIPAKLDAKLRDEIEDVAARAFRALGCRDIARIDVRMDAAGIVNFIECNPLPGLAPKWSDLARIAEQTGLDYTGLIGEILAPALRRFRAKHPEQNRE